jgi:NADPH-dependent 2,4-dienoyl-CoA reductase/sulfur reductase-like enzyme
VLVVGGGPAGTAAAIAAGRLGANVLLVERYNHLGGLSTGGLVIWIDRMTDWSGRQVIRGLADELMERLRRMRFRARHAPIGETAMPRPPPIGRSGQLLTMAL